MAINCGPLAWPERNDVGHTPSPPPVTIPPYAWGSNVKPENLPASTQQALRNEQRYLETFHGKFPDPPKCAYCGRWQGQGRDQCRTCGAPVKTVREVVEEIERGYSSGV